MISRWFLWSLSSLSISFAAAAQPRYTPTSDQKVLGNALVTHELIDGMAEACGSLSNILNLRAAVLLGHTRSEAAQMVEYARLHSLPKGPAAESKMDSHFFAKSVCSTTRDTN
jgi:hypothetical protein